MLGGGRLGPYGMVLPFVCLFGVFFAAPLGYALYLSFTSELTGKIVGLINYRAVLQDSVFWGGLARVGYFGAVEVSIMVVLSLGLALLVNTPYAKARRFFSVVYFLPYAVPGVVAATLWGFLMSPSLDGALGVTKLLGLTKGPLDPLSGGVLLYAIMLIVTWEFTGYNVAIYSTALTAIPKPVIEAAYVDGAPEWRLALNIKLPYLRRMLVFTIVLSIIGTLQLFTEPYILSELVSISANYTPNMLMYEQAFSFNNLPFAAAGCVVLTGITVVPVVMLLGGLRASARRTNSRRAEPVRITAVPAYKGSVAGAGR